MLSVVNSSRTLVQQVGEDAALRYFLARGTVGVATFSDYVRTAVGGVVAFGAPLALAGALGRAGQRQAMHTVQRWCARHIVRHLDIQLDIIGMDQIDPLTGYVVTPLHEGFIDVPALLHLPLKLRFAARDELFTWRFLGGYLRDSGQVYVAPERGRWSYRHLLMAAREVFATGENLVIFPQGTILGIETDFLRGAFALAKALDKPILPIALTGSHRVWEYPYTSRLRYGQRMSLRVLEPVSVEQCRALSADDLCRTIQRRLKTAALEDDLVPPRRFVPARDGYWDGFAYEIDPDFPELAADVAHHRCKVSERRAAA